MFPFLLLAMPMKPLCGTSPFFVQNPSDPDLSLLVHYRRLGGAWVGQIQYRDDGGGEASTEAAAQNPPEQETEALFRMSGTKYVEGGRGESTVAERESESASSLHRSESQLFPLEDETSAAASDTGSVMRIDLDDDEDAFVDALMDHGDEQAFQEHGTRDQQAPLAPQRVPLLCHSSLEMLSRIDARCPFFLDVIKNRGGYSRVYLIQPGEEGVRSFRTLRECEELAEASRGKAQRVVSDAFSPRLSGSERLRRVVGCILASPETCLPGSPADGGLNKLAPFITTRSAISATETLFLRRAEPVLSDRERAGLRWSGFAARAVSDRHWIEEFVAVSHRSVSFSHPDKRKASARVVIRSIESVAPLAPDVCPPGVSDAYWFVEIETLGRSIYLMFGSARARDGFLNEVQSLRTLAREDVDADISIASNPLALDVENPADEFMHKSTLWNLKNRRLLNGGKYYFTVARSTNALEIVETALRRASTVANDSPRHEEFELRHAFLVSAARLKQANVLGLPEEWRLVFFLNLYHLMTLHAFIVLGPPDSSLQWIAYFNNAAYETGDDIFSLAELEHCIVRSNLSGPSQFLSRFVIPKTRYRDDLALSRLSDFRVNFALNCGSRSNPGSVLCYRVASLRTQLDSAARLYLEGTTFAVRGGNQSPSFPGAGNGNSEILVLCFPRVCQWFLPDFGDSPEQLIVKVEPYLPDAVRRVLERFKTTSGARRLDMSRISVRYDTYNFECRPFVVAMADPL
jgi:hypothetical protein